VGVSHYGGYSYGYHPTYVNPGYSYTVRY
jgi:hypothetical protein